MTEVKSIRFYDYKCFSSYLVSAGKKNVLVGPNNSGKSTVLDAFRIAFDALRFAKRKSAVFKSQGNDGVCSTYFVPISVIQSDLRYCVHNFGDGIAKIEMKLDNGNTFVIKIPGSAELECYLKTGLKARKNAQFLRDQFPVELVVVPTLSPLEQNEELVRLATVERNRFGRLASRNFRNFWLHKTEQEFEAFADLVELGWPGIRLTRPEIEKGGDRPYVRMYFRDGPHVREVQWAGFGFQVWMQTMMHLSQTDHKSTLILDEPDIYLHPDLQHKLLRFISQRVGQYFIATHSTEIINDVEPGEVLIVRSGSRSAKRIQNEEGYPDVYDAIGSSENAQFARLARTKKVLYFEGNDVRILSKIAKTLGRMDFISNASITIMKTDGFSNWTRVSTSSWVFKNFFDFDVPVAALFDRDHKCGQEIDEFLSKLNSSDTLCRVLPFKELENILLVPKAIKAVISKFRRGDLPQGWEDDVDSIILSSCNEVKSKVLAKRIGSRISYETSLNSRADVQTISAEEEKEFTKNWEDTGFQRRVVPGKEVFSNVARQIQEKYKVTLTSSRVVDQFDVADIHPDFFTILKDIQIHLGE